MNGDQTVGAIRCHRETLNFIRRHWPHLLLIPPGALLVTILHESAHAIVVLVQGGTLLQFVWLPDAGKWGYISYEFPAGVRYSEFLISIAPYLLWFLLAIFTFLLSLCRQRLAYWKASVLYLWLFVVPLADVANTAFPYLAGKDNDFRSAFGQPSLFVGLSIGLVVVISIIGGYCVQSRLYREDGLSASTYLALSTVALVMILTVTV